MVIVLQLSAHVLCRTDIYRILNDLTLAYILHQDLRPPNLIHAPKNTAMCHRHKCVHKWNVIDFAWVSADIVERDPAKYETVAMLQRMRYRSDYFYTGSHYKIPE